MRRPRFVPHGFTRRIGPVGVIAVLVLGPGGGFGAAKSGRDPAQINRTMIGHDRSARVAVGHAIHQWLQRDRAVPARSRAAIGTDIDTYASMWRSNSRSPSAD